MEKYFIYNVIMKRTTNESTRRSPKKYVKGTTTQKPKKFNIKKILIGVIGGSLGSLAAITAGVYVYASIKGDKLSKKRKTYFSQKAMIDDSYKTWGFNKKMNEMYDTAVENYKIHKDKEQYDNDIMVIHKLLQRQQ